MARAPLAVGAIVVLACSESQLPPPSAESLPANQSLGASEPGLDTVVPPEVGAPDGEWPIASGDYANTRFSGLTQITAGNVARLEVSWTFSTGVLRGQEAAPIVAEQAMYVVTPFPNILHALDLTNPGSTRWSYEPKPESAAQGVACCDVVNRGAAYADGRVFFNTLDNNTIAVDAKTGKVIWRTRLGDINRGETMTMAPLVVKGKVLVGNSGGELGVRGWITALDAASGTIAWRAYSTGPDEEVLLGERFKPFYSADRESDLGVKSWPGDAWKIGGGNVWGFVSYDPGLDLVYYGTANPGPWNPDVRPGDNKWTSAVFARDPDDGQGVWAYQWNPHDLFDHDGINENVLLDLDWKGTPRKVLVHADRNGYVYVLDRTSGEVLSAQPFHFITAYRGVDLRTGRVQPVSEKEPKTGTVVRMICPSAPGAKDWQPMAWSPRTRLLYIPHQNLCMDFEATDANYIAGTPYVGANVKYYAGPGGHRGELSAWDPVAGKAVWTLKERFPVWSGTLTTAGDVVFYGTMDGWFKAIHARTGAELWRFKTGSGIIGQPVTYRGPDGKQYVAVLAGVGGWSGAIVSAGLDPRDSTAGGGFVNAMKDLPQHTTKGGMLYVFGLP
ncbi:MAG TPA: methanol/ethanol family PQQ-dependent dehydrogenase [Gemmatimonadales bacterium]|nr:methanol/ethanol family PQQ-dependent dehydrogenase [Gemmatimonadales bacterium]